MSEMVLNDNLPSSDYNSWRDKVIGIVTTAQIEASLSVNSSMLQMYWDIGHEILQKQELKGWGSRVIEQLSEDLKLTFIESSSFSVRNLRYMKRFAKEYPSFPILQVPLAELENGEVDFSQIQLAQITWYHHISLISKVKDIKERAFYISEAAKNGWSRDIMMMQIDGGLYQRQGKCINNFNSTLPAVHSDLARDIFKDPYKFNFLNLSKKATERDIELQLIDKITDFLIEMGKHFAYVGRQYHITVDNDDYYIDILMYHLKLHCYVVVELKAVEFIPEFISKLNFYISAVDDNVKSEFDNPTIGLLLCRSKSNVKAEYSLRGVTQPLGIAEYETERILQEVRSSLPSIEEIEAQLVIDNDVD